MPDNAVTNFIFGKVAPGIPERGTIDQSIPGVVDTIEAQAGKSGLQYLNYQGQAVRW
jgi:hypothetical protein